MAATVRYNAIAMEATNFKYEEEFIKNSKGLELFTCRWLPVDTEPRALVFLNHGYAMECSVSMKGAALRLVKAGFAVYGIDNQGHGKSAGLKGYVPSFDDLVTDCTDFFTSICEKKENKRKMRILLGESMGGAMVLLLHRKKPEYWDGGVLVAPMLGKAPDVPFVTYKWRYYLTDEIYPEWDVLMKSISQPESNDVKRIRYKQAHEAARKDVERAFSVLKKKWIIVRTPARSRSLKRITHLMYTCIILHNMIRKEKGKTITLDFYPKEQHREDDLVKSAQDRLRVIREIHDEETHLNLKADLVEHIWHRTNAN
ncbi:caffeoylshikimate esterase-like protein [Tanacetum coccineum]|uniref:Caffeoylshikimate esterase-like protein n=1 Tax=Tanacetum coccineum TaxID=301880 RepID=A0ABQ5HTB2_9ASTR